MYMKPIVEMDITKIIEKFNQNKSAGDDNIGNFNKEGDKGDR